jgi:hypothetical protein
VRTDPVGDFPVQARQEFKQLVGREAVVVSFVAGDGDKDYRGEAFDLAEAAVAFRPFSKGTKMTLIAAQLSRDGIVLATDSNLTESNLTTGIDRFAGQVRKNFELPHLRGGLSVAGCWSVNGVPMDEWMPRFIARPETFASQSLADFTEHLRSALESEMLHGEKQSGSMVHVAGYALDATLGFHPEFHYIRNTHGIRADGNYETPGDAFLSSEDFWSRDCHHQDSPTGFPLDAGIYKYQYYVNGYPEGRIGYVGAQAQLNSFFQTMWGNPAWKFRPPHTLQESICFVRLLMSVINGLFDVSDYAAPYIGGDVQIIGIPLPLK